MLPAPPQSDAAAGASGEMEKIGEATKFISWANKGAADLILPELEDNSDADDDEK